MLKKILIANRGEIALRIIRACREMGIETLAVYSEADEQSIHCQVADDAICIGPASSGQSYLKADRILSAAELANVDAIHPGYGFLAENADFAEQCESCNIKFIGPSSKTIRMMGDKALARETVKAAKVPVIPGSQGAISDDKEALKLAKEIGFPVIIKAVSGGGGRGMRVAHNAVAFQREFETARNEADKAFGDASVYIEKFIQDPRHIEFQILADEHGKVVHLGERDCSVQRRHQKVIEEAPSPFLSADQRRRMGRVAVKAAEAANYSNAGTIEFLVDKGGDFFFIEMNTRIQVEHPVTEIVTGIDLIKKQIQIAAGEPLGLEQKQIRVSGHAIECRICAEDPSRNFTPSPGVIGVYFPPGGPGVRVDSHAYSGYPVPSHYDSLIGKLITYGETRDEAIVHMNRALKEYLVRGIHTNIPFLQAIVSDPVFRQGQTTTRYVEEFLARTPRYLLTPTQPDNT